MSGRLAGKRILVVEDEYFIASDLKRALRREEADVVGPTGNFTEALSLVAQPLDAAILDVNLEGAMSYGIADRLGQEAVPFMFLTGYDGWALPDVYRRAPRVAKPFAIDAVLSCVQRLVGEGGTHGPALEG